MAKEARILGFGYRALNQADGIQLTIEFRVIKHSPPIQRFGAMLATRFQAISNYAGMRSEESDEQAGKARLFHFQYGKEQPPSKAVTHP